jgi:hypothetical protein
LEFKRENMNIENEKSPDSWESRRFNTERELLEKLKDHVVQLEAFVAFLIIINVVIYALSTSKVSLPVWLVPSLFLILMRPMMRVTNPTGPMRNALVWAGTFGGVCGAAVGATTDILAGGLTGGQGTLIGISAGAAVGASLGNWIEGWGTKDKLVERGDAFQYLYKHRKKEPKLANPSQINKALDEDIESFDINEDGRHWYAIASLDKYISNLNNH